MSSKKKTSPKMKKGKGTVTTVQVTGSTHILKPKKA